MKKLFLVVLLGIGLSLNLAVAESVPNLENSNSISLQQNQTELSDEAIKELENQCIKDLHVCERLGNFYLNSGNSDITNAFKFYQIACNGGSISACYEVANLLIDDNYLPKNLDLAKTILEQNCRNNHIKSCDKIKEIQ